MIKLSFFNQSTRLTLVCILVSALLVAGAYINLFKLTKINYGTTVVQKSFEPTCNTTLFHEELRLDDDPPYIPRELLANCDKVLYNRIPKSASTTFKELFEILAPRNNVTAIFLHKKWKMKQEQREAFVRRLQSSFNGGFVLTGHYYFDSFEDVLGDTGVYIQVIREPTDWIISYLNWQKYGTVMKPTPRKGFSVVEIEACIYDDNCIYSKFNFAGALTFICGQYDFCRLGTEESYLQAIRNIERYYLVVGLFEDLPSYVEVLEYLMPHVFSNITNVFTEQGKTYYQSTKTRHKEGLSEEALSTLREKIPFHNKLYTFAKTRFYKMVKAVRKLKTLSRL